MELKKEAVRGVKWTSLSTGITVAIQLIQTAILARILDPEDYGLMALANIAMGFVSIFLDMGISYAIISKPNITHKQLSSLYWLNIVIGLLLFIGLSSLSPVIAAFYDEPQLITIIILTSLTFVSSSFSIQYYALLSKDLKFDTLSKISIAGQGVTFIVSVVLAYKGFEVYSLVYAYILSSFVNSILLIVFGRKYHKPSFNYSYIDIKEFVSFGTFQIGERTITYFNAQFDSLLIGKILGPGALGFYTLAKNLAVRPIDVINPIITKVSIPIMSKVSHDVIYLKKIYMKTIEFLCSINFPLYGLFFLLAEPIILFLYGPKWIDSIPLFRLLSIYFLLRSTFNPIGSLLISKGKADWGFYWNLAFFIITPLAIWVGSYWGITGVIYSLIFIMLAGIYPLHRFMISTIIPVSLFEYLKVIVMPILFVGIAGAVTYNFLDVFSDTIVSLIFIGLVFSLVYLIFIYIFNRPLIKEIISFKNK